MGFVPFRRFSSRSGAKPLLGPRQPVAAWKGPRDPKERRHGEPGAFALPSRLARRPPVQPPTGAGNGGSYTQILRTGKRKAAGGPSTAWAGSRGNSHADPSNIGEQPLAHLECLALTEKVALVSKRRSAIQPG